MTERRTTLEKALELTKASLKHQAAQLEDARKPLALARASLARLVEERDDATERASIPKPRRPPATGAAAGTRTSYGAPSARGGAPGPETRQARTTAISIFQIRLIPVSDFGAVSTMAMIGDLLSGCLVVMASFFMVFEVSLEIKDKKKGEK